MQTYSNPYLNWYLNQGNMYNMTGICGYGCDYGMGEAIGLGVMNTLGQLGSIFAVRYAMKGAGGGGGSSKVTTNPQDTKLQTERDQVLDDIDKQLDILGENYTIDNFEKATAEQKYQDAIDTAQKNIDTTNQTIRSDKATLETSQTDLNNKKAQLATMKEQDGYDKDPEYHKLEAEIKELEEKTIPDLKKKIEENEKKVKEGGEFYKALKAAEKAKEDRQTEINKAIEEIKTLKADLAKIDEEIEKNKAYNSPDEMNEVLDDADGNWIQRKLKGDRGDMMQKVREFRKLKLEYDKTPNTAEGQATKSRLKSRLIALAGDLDTIYNNASDKDRKNIDKDATLQTGWQTIKDWVDNNR